jgi:hypothetical protein
MALHVSALLAMFRGSTLFKIAVDFSAVLSYIVLSYKVG